MQAYAQTDNAAHTQTNKKGNGGIWTWVGEPSHDNRHTDAGDHNTFRVVYDSHEM